MTEASLKAVLVQLLRKELPRFVVFRHEDRITGGIPDISVTGNGFTSWWEVKFANPDFKCPGIQELTAKRLGANGRCFFIVYAQRKKQQDTFIVRPDRLSEWMNSEEKAERFNHRFVLDYIRGVHS